MKAFVVAGTGTGVGKTLISALLVEALGADYWKPVQAGDLEKSDTMTVSALVSHPRTVFHPETYRLNHPMSPHAAAALDQTEIRPEAFRVPETKNTLLIELAGGLMVPLNSEFLNLDLVKLWNYPVILVSGNYLGSINHTLLSLEILKQNQVPVAGIIFNGPENPASEEFILRYSGVKCLAHVREMQEVSRQEIKRLAGELPISL
jgi:dethiobiotin synthetase